MPKSAPATALAEIKRRYTLDDRIYDIPWEVLPKHMQTNALKKGYEKGQHLLFPSNTTVLHLAPVRDSWFEQWKANEIEQKGAEGARFALWVASERGKKVHKAIEEWFDGKPLYWFHPETEEKIFDDHEWSCINNFMEFVKIFPTTIIKKEETVFSVEYGYAGTLDIAAMIAEKKMAGDWKTSAKITDDYLMQVVAYMYADEEMHPEEPKYDSAFVLSLRTPDRKNKGMTTHKAEFLNRNECDAIFKKFLNRLAVYKDEYPDGLADTRRLLPEAFIP